MLSLYKLYKADKAVAHKAVTYGPKGKPYHKSKGSPCYRHCGVDWTVHRLAPTLISRGGPKRKKIIGKALSANPPESIKKRVPGLAADKGWKNAMEKHPEKTLMKSSPRWGEGSAPSTRPRKVVPLQKKGDVEMSGKTMAAGGAAVGVGGSYAVRQSSHKGRDKK